MRFYPRYDTVPSSIDEAVSILRQSIEDLLGGTIEAATTSAPEIRVGALAIPLDTIEPIDLTPATFHALRSEIAAVELERYGTVSHYPPDVLRAGRRPLLQYSAETLEATMSSPSAMGVALRDRVSGRVVAYALGSMLEDHDEEGVHADPHFGENNTFYLQAMATLPTVQNNTELENYLFETIRARAIAAGFLYLSMLIEEQLLQTGPAWLRGAAVLERIENYLGSGSPFAYFQLALTKAPENGTSGDGNSAPPQT